MTKNRFKIAGVIVLFNPGNEVIESIYSYLDYIDKLFVIDNSETYNYYLLEKFKTINKITYISNNGNKGIANALNLGAELALKNNSDFLLTMDQDSKFKPEMLMRMIDFINNYEQSNLGILSPFHEIGDNLSFLHQIGFLKFLKKIGIKSPFRKIGRPLNKPDELISELLVVMTSGNLLNLDAYKNTGKFEEKLFIDHVDHEYCLKLKKNGYRVIQLNTASLFHSLGNKKEITFPFKQKIFFLSHNPIRTYYLIRNGFYVANKYKKDFPYFYRYIFKILIEEFLKIIFFETNKIKRLNLFINGYIDYKKKVFFAFKDD